MDSDCTVKVPASEASSILERLRLKGSYGEESKDLSRKSRVVFEERCLFIVKLVETKSVRKCYVSEGVDIDNNWRRGQYLLPILYVIATHISTNKW